MRMLTGTLCTLMGCVLFMLRLGGGTFPRPLSAQEEQDAIRRWMAGDMEARNTLVEHNLRLVSHIIKKYYAPPDEQEDLVSIGTVGLIKGVSTYRPDRGVRLTTYASRCIENEILMYFRSKRKSAGDVSLSDTLEADEEGGLSLLDTIAEDSDLLEEVSARETADQLRRCVRERLDEREARVITLRYGLDGAKPMPQREVAALCGISRSYVSRIEKHALEKLRWAMGGQ